MAREVRQLFESELRQRGLDFSVDTESGRHAVEVEGTRLLISLDNLQKDVAADGDVSRVSHFVDTIVASATVGDAELSSNQLYWCLEPSDYEERADFRVTLSDRVERVLVHSSADGRLITWVTPEMLDTLGLSEEQAAAKAFANLAKALHQATVEIEEIDGVKLGFLGTTLPFKASLMLAPNLCEVLGDALGWPLLAVAPDRDFLYLWAARHVDFASRLGAVVVREYTKASYPVSTEVYKVDDDGIRAIGEFPTGA